MLFKPHLSGGIKGISKQKFRLRKIANYFFIDKNSKLIDILYDQGLKLIGSKRELRLKPIYRRFKTAEFKIGWINASHIS